MNEKEKQRIEKEAKAMLEKFAKALDKVELKEIKAERDGESYRKEGLGEESEEDFRKRMFENAPHKDDNCIIAEKVKW